MKAFKKSLRLLGLGLLIILASFGIGLAGGAPIPSHKRRENLLEIKTEQIDGQDSEEGRQAISKE